jgi:hypothetical protein
MRGAIGLARAQLRWLVAIREDVLRLGASDGD